MPGLDLANLTTKSLSLLLLHAHTHHNLTRRSLTIYSLMISRRRTQQIYWMFCVVKYWISRNRTTQYSRVSSLVLCWRVANEPTIHMLVGMEVLWCIHREKTDVVFVSCTPPGKCIPVFFFILTRENGLESYLWETLGKCFFFYGSFS